MGDQDGILSDYDTSDWRVPPPTTTAMLRGEIARLRAALVLVSRTIDAGSASTAGYEAREALRLTPAWALQDKSEDRG